MTDLDVMAPLVTLWLQSGWRRLEISQHDGRYGGYCVPDSGRAIQTADALRAPECPEVITRLAELLGSIGWRRLEIVGNPRTGRAGGWCQRADESGFRVAYMPERGQR